MDPLQHPEEMTLEQLIEEAEAVRTRRAVFWQESQRTAWIKRLQAVAVHLNAPSEVLVKIRDMLRETREE